MQNEYTVFFDDVDVRELGLLFLAGHSNPLLSGTRDRDTTIAGRHGSLDYGADLDPIPFNIPLYIPTKNPFDLQTMVRKVKAILLDANGKPRTFKLKFGYEPDKYYNVRVTGNIPIERIVARSGKFNLPLICHEGFARSMAKHGAVLWGSEVVVFHSDYSMGATGSSAKVFAAAGTTTVTVIGNNVKPMLYVVGTGTNVTISFNNKTMNLGSFNNAFWVIDLDEYAVIKDGENGMKYISGSWLTMELVNGDNVVTVTGTGLNLDVSFDFNDKWYG